MRKLLLASSALLGASFGIVGSGYAGTLTPNAQNPAPGSITVTLNALVETFVFDSTDSGTQPENNGGNKTATYGVASYTRLYPSFDGKLANGIKYGASVEFRQYQGYGTNLGGPNDPGTIYVQRSFLYVGADQFGKLEFGTPVQPSELFQTGNPANFNTGGWDGDLPGVFRTGLPYFIDDSNDRAEKAVYVSPQFSGFDFGVSFEPNNFGNDFGSAVTRVSSAASTPIVDPTTGIITGYTDAPQLGHRRDTVDGAARYQGTFGSIGFKANVAGSFGGAVKSNTGPSYYFDNTGTVQFTTGVPQYKNFSLLGGGISATFGGLELDGHIDWGKFGPGLSSLQTGGGHTTAYVTGASYTLGPWIWGASYYGFDSGYTQSTPGAGALHGYGLAAGGTYTLAPGASVFLEYLYGHQRANGYDLYTNSAGTTGNNTRSQAFGIGTAFKW
jgi:outer membrane protein OmpU